MYLHSYNKEWPLEYQKEESEILSVYDGNIKLHHIGSTAVAGLYAKDCIDILGVVENITQVKENVETLQKLGFEYKGEYGIKGREYFSKKTRKVHFHIFQERNVNIQKHLGFVQIMNMKPTLISELNSLKRELAEKYPLDKEQYQKEKKFFYDDIHKML